MKYVALDFETANFKRHSVCSIGLVFIEDAKIISTYNKLIRPTPDYYEPINISIHGITSEITKDAPTFADLWEEIQPMINNQQLVAHNASFDFSALRSVLTEYKIGYPKFDYFCSMLISKKVFPGLMNYQLPTVSKHLGILDLNHHDALSDAKASALIISKILDHTNTNSLEELERQVKFSRGRIFPNSYYPFSCSGTTKSTNLFESIDPKREDKEHPFYGKHLVFTGNIEKLSRNDARQVVESIGGRTTPPNLSSKTNYLIVGTYDFSQFGEGFKSSKLKKAEQYISEGKNLEIISETDFLRMIHQETASFEIKVGQIETDSINFLKRNKYNDLSGRNVFFSQELSIERTTAFQYVGNCSGYGHDYDTSEIANSDYFIISDKIINTLKEGIKHQCILNFEQIRNSAQNRGDVKSIKLLSESSFLEYMDRRLRYQQGENNMHINEWEIDGNNVP